MLSNRIENISLSKPPFAGQKAKLGDVVSAYNKRNKGLLCTDVYSVTNSQGFAPSSEYFSKEVFSKDLGNYRLVKKGMLAYNPSRINVGSIALQDKLSEVVVSPLYVVFEPDSSRVNPEYILHFLKSKPGLHQIAFQSIGSVRNNLKFEALCRMELSLPSLEQQQQRIGHLNAISTYSTKLEMYLSKLDQLIKSRFVEMFGDEEHNQRSYPIKSFNDLAVLITDGEHKTPKREGSGVYLLSARNVQDHYLDLSRVDYIGTEEYERISKRVVPQAGDVLVSCSGTIGRCCIVPERIQFQMVRSVALIRFNSEVNPVFMSYQISTDGIQSQISKMATQSSQANLFQGKIRQLQAIIPPLELQQEFADFVVQVDKSRFVGCLQVTAVHPDIFLIS